jgi:two-component system, response regulator PdtaR
MKVSLRIVAADDEPEMRAYFKETLEALGHRVVGLAANGEELIALSRKERPDLVIADIKMPGTNGIDAARQLYHELPVPVIVVSAYHDNGIMERAQAPAVMAYLVKPIKSEDLKAAIFLAMRRFAEFQSLMKEAASLKQAMEDRKIIERAKGILMKQAKLDEGDAFKRLQDLASNKNQKMIEIAKMVVTMRDAFEPKT